MKWRKVDEHCLASSCGCYTITKAQHHGPEGEFVYMLHHTKDGTYLGIIGARSFDSDELKTRAENHAAGRTA